MSNYHALKKFVKDTNESLGEDDIVAIIYNANLRFWDLRSMGLSCSKQFYISIATISSLMSYHI